MDIRHLRHFLAVVETGSFHAAAERLHLTQQAVSRSVKSLEVELGVRLLERRARDRRKVSPTEFGKLLLPHAMSVAKGLQTLQQEFENLLGSRRSLIRFAATPTAMRRLIAPALPLFRARKPKVRIQAMQLVLPSIVSRLAEGAFDFIVTDEPAEPLSERFEVDVLLQDCSVLLCGPTHPLARVSAANLTGQVLAKHKWIGFGPFMPTLAATRAIFESAGLELPARNLETSSLDLTLAELASGRYLAMLPRQLVAAELAAKRLVALPLPHDPTLDWNLVVASLVDRPRSADSRQFIDCLRTVAAESAPAQGTTAALRR